MTKTETIHLADIQVIHLDAVGGVAGDMFAAACLDALPELWPLCAAAIRALQPPPGITANSISHTDGVLSGLRFVVNDQPLGDTAEPHSHGNNHNHDHTHWRNIRQHLETSGLEPEATTTAIAIFSRLAEAEAKVHGIDVDAVAFHEVGAWDSIIDIVVAATIITRLAGCRWTIGPLPRGRGLVRTAHGMLPLPAPATIELLHGFTMFDDGEDGERITPTGAAILNHLAANQQPDKTSRRLMASGTGFGTRKFKHRSNILRATAYGAAPSTGESDTIEVLRCEIDDQSPEDLAIALRHVRVTGGVLDVCQWPVFAKKGRMAVAIQVLVRDGFGDRIARLLLDETSTLGVRRSTVARSIVERTHHDSTGGVRVKRAQRPSGATVKAESDDIRNLTTTRARDQARRRAEEEILTPDSGEDDDNG